MQRLRRLEDGALILGFSTGYLSRMARAGIIPSYRVGVHGYGVHFDVEEVRAVLRSDADGRRRARGRGSEPRR